MKKLMLPCATWLLCCCQLAWAGYAEEQAAQTAELRGDYVTALKEFHTLAAQGDAFAQFHIGIMYALGEGVERDVAESIKWLKLASSNGSDLAQSALGDRYHDGVGVPVDYREALRLYRLSAARGVPESTVGMARMYAHGEGVHRHAGAAYALYTLYLPYDLSGECKLALKSLANELTPQQTVEAALLTQQMRNPANLLNALDQYLAKPANK
ncbi:MAG: sel1 repeat family protein [Burkholderiales bacterium]|nr:sel1 repeat family protein [Burkholderiales bacterium]